jgi:ABC-type multidrug transport system, ATPase and permease components
LDAVKKETSKPDKPKFGMWSNTKYMLSLARKNCPSVIVLCIVLAALEVANSLTGLFIAPVILGRVEAAAPLGELIGTIALFCAALLLCGAVIAYINSNTIFGRIKLRLDIMWGISEKFSTTSYPNTESDAVRKLQDKACMAVNSNSSATEAVWGTFTSLLQNGAGFVIYLAMLTTLDPVILAVTLTATVGGFLLTKRINEWGYRHREEDAEYSRRMNYVISKAEDYTIAKDIRIFGMRPWLEDVYLSAQRLFRAFKTKGEKIYIWANVIDVALSLIRNGVAYAYLLNLTLQNGLTASQFLLYFAAVGGFAGWVSGIMGNISTLHMQSLDLSTIREFYEYPEPFLFESGEAISPETGKKYSIELRGVCLRYPGADKDTLHNINLKLGAGEKLAVVGLNGAGKTTLVRLMCGLYDPTGGEVLLNGVNIKKYNRHDYYSMFSAVFQQFSLLECSLAENVAQTDTAIDTAEVKRCVEQAGLSEKVAALPSGLDTHIGRMVYEDGVELSGGETQRLMLARALYKNAPIIILDEPTAALDPIAESDIYNKYNDMTSGRTSVYISHRLASTRFCDRIVLLDGGDIAEEGTHESLLALGGKYAELFEIQSRYYREGRDADGSR